MKSRHFSPLGLLFRFTKTDPEQQSINQQGGKNGQKLSQKLWSLWSAPTETVVVRVWGSQARVHPLTGLGIRHGASTVSLVNKNRNPEVPTCRFLQMFCICESMGRTANFNVKL